MKRPIRIANCSGFYGDRRAAAREMVEGGPIDVLTGDWLAELTMLIMARTRMKNGPGTGYAHSFLTQMHDVLGTCLERGIRVVVNAGGLDPAGCARALQAQAAASGLGSVRIAYVEGDDLVPRWPELLDAGLDFTNIDTGEQLHRGTPFTANAYLGGRGITAALDADADVVITGRVTDAAVIVGPAAWWHGWSYDEPGHVDALAGAVVAGHVIECGAQATGGNYAFFGEVPGIEHLGFPWAEIAADGSSVIGKHDDGTGGIVTAGTVTAQLLYEIGSPTYLNPDVIADFTSIELTDLGGDRVAIGPVRGSTAPADLKVAINTIGGLRNSMTLVLTGLDIEAKADVALRAVAGVTLGQAQSLDPVALAASSTLRVEELDVDLLRYDRPDPARIDESQAMLRITVSGADATSLGRAFTAPVIEATLASYPGMFPTAPPSEPRPFGSYWPTTIPNSYVSQEVWLLPPQVGDERARLDDPVVTAVGGAGAGSDAGSDAVHLATLPGGGTAGSVRHVPVPVTEHTSTSSESAAGDALPFGTFVGARSGDKGGNANIGLWVRRSTPELDLARYEWLRETMDSALVRRLLPEAAELLVEIYALPNLLAVNIVIVGLLGRGVAETTRLDPQAKGLGEHIRARIVRIPRDLLADNVAQ